MSTVKPFWKFGEMKKSQYGKNEYYIKVDNLPKGVEELVFRVGDSIILIKPEDELQALVEKDVITEEQAQERLTKIPPYVKMLAKYVPKRDKKG